MTKNLFNLDGKVAIVTGGNGGIGKGIALGLAGAGVGIAIAARNHAKIQAALKEVEALGVKAIGITTDVKDEVSVTSMVQSTIEALGRVDILVNNAGVALRKKPQDYTLEEWNDVLDINLTGAFLCSKAVYPPMKKAGGGKIINIGSMTSIFGSELVASYATSKGGIVQLTKSLAIAWARDKIQVNAILPGWIHTDLTGSIRSRTPERYQSILSRIPAQRWGSPQDLEGTVIFLASPASDYVTGASLPVDGGYSVT